MTVSEVLVLVKDIEYLELRFYFLFFNIILR